MKENIKPNYEGLTVHINAIPEDIASIVIMPGDPLRAKYIADKYLTNAKIVSSIRNNYMYTGEYKGKRITVAASGRGIPSMGIYAYELYNFYNVEKIIRIGSTGGYADDIKLMDIILASESYSENTSFCKANLDKDLSNVKPSEDLNNDIIKTAEELNIGLKVRKVHTSDMFTFYNTIPKDELWKSTGNAASVEMETYALFISAMRTNKKAASLLTVVAHIIRKESLSADIRENELDKMILIALESTLK